MNEPLICMTLTGKTLEENLKLVKKYEKHIDLVELRVDYLTEDGLYVTVDISLEDDYPVRLKLVAHDEIGGTYKVENLDGFKEDVWLCNVVHVLFGEHPEYIFIDIEI